MIGRLDDALLEDQRSIELDPSNADAHSNLAWLLGKQAHFGQAAREARVALQLDPNNPSSYMTLGLALASQDDYDGAIAADARAIQLDPDNTKAFINLAATLGRKGDYQSSIAAYRRALQLQPNSVAAHLGLGAALGKSGLVDEQIQHFKLACQLAPGSDSAHGKLGWAYYKKGNFEGALQEGWITNWIRLQKSGPAYLQKFIGMWGAVFLLFGLIFAVIFLGSNFKPEPGERVLKSYFLTFYKDKPGRFIVTDKRLLFVPEAFSRWFGSVSVSVQRDQLRKVEALAEGRSKVLMLEMSDGSNFKFSLPQLVLKPLLAELALSSPAAAQAADDKNADAAPGDKGAP